MDGNVFAVLIVPEKIKKGDWITFYQSFYGILQRRYRLMFCAVWTVKDSTQIMVIAIFQDERVRFFSNSGQHLEKPGPNINQKSLGSTFCNSGKFIPA